MAEKPSLRSQVEGVLTAQPATRNSDIDLTMWVWYTHYKEKLEWQEAIGQREGRWIVSLSNVRLLPSEDKISRIRRKLQEDGQYPATDPVVIARREKENKVRSTIKTSNWDDNL